DRIAGLENDADRQVEMCRIHGDNPSSTWPMGYNAVGDPTFPCSFHQNASLSRCFDKSSACVLRRLLAFENIKACCLCSQVIPASSLAVWPVHYKKLCCMAR